MFYLSNHQLFVKKTEQRSLKEPDLSKKTVTGDKTWVIQNDPKINLPEKFLKLKIQGSETSSKSADVNQALSLQDSTHL
jgi:hypothetical protein